MDRRSPKPSFAVCCDLLRLEFDSTVFGVETSEDSNPILKGSSSFPFSPIKLSNERELEGLLWRLGILPPPGMLPLMGLRLPELEQLDLEGTSFRLLLM
jgi:hypothetical protein